MEAARREHGQIGPYRLESRLGGTQGAEVWIARRSDRRGPTVALKVGLVGGQFATTSFKDELRAAQSLSHTGLLPIVDTGESESGFYVAYELIEGPSLASLLERLTEKRSFLPASAVTHLGLRVSEVLGYVASHAAIDGLSVKLTHRHLSPSNVLLSPNGQVRLADFGVPSGIANTVPGTGRVLRGDPAYLAPEQIRDEATDQRTDVFALGALLYHAAALERPFRGKNADEILRAVQDHDPPLLNDVVPGFPLSLSQVIRRSLSKDPLLRPATALELRASLLECAAAIGGASDAQNVLTRAIEGAYPARDYASSAKPAPKTDRFEATTAVIETKPPPALTSQESEVMDTADPTVTSPPPLGMESKPAAPTQIIQMSAAKGSRHTSSSRPATAVPIIKPAPKLTLEDWLSKVGEVFEDQDRSRLALAVGGGVIVVLLAALIAARSSSEHDDHLRRAYESQDYSEVEKYFIENMARFKYPESAFELASDARMRRLGATVPVAPKAAAPAAGEDETSPKPEGGQTLALPELALPAEIPPPPAQNKSDKKARARALKLELSGLRALEMGDTEAAEASFRACLQEREHPGCHFQLARLRHSKGDIAGAAEHFDRYLFLWSDAPQGEEIRQWIARARSLR
jgi:eukaryotic-like serine/threonine-protein kinase